MVVAVLSVFLLVLLPLVYGLFGSEKSVTQAFHAHAYHSPGVDLALRYAADRESVKNLPKVALCSDTVPIARVTRTLIGSGTIVVSQGLLTTFQDDELVAVMQQALRVLKQRGVVGKSACSAWFYLLEGVWRRPWTPLRAVVSWMFFPIRSFLQGQDRSLDLFKMGQSSKAKIDPAWIAATHKASCVERIFS